MDPIRGPGGQNNVSRENHLPAASRIQNGSSVGPGNVSRDNTWARVGDLWRHQMSGTVYEMFHDETP